MYALAAILFFLFGTIIGSFLNVVILRFNTGVALAGRSRCFSCGRTIRWYDLVPVLSFLYLHGRCRFCKSKLSAQYPFVEFLTGLLFLAVFLKYSLPVFSPEFSIFYFLFSIDILIFSLLLVITIYDLRHKIIPDSFAVGFAVLSLLRLFLNFGTELFRLPHLLDLLAGPILALPFFLLWLVSRGRWMGLGDAKLAWGMGWFLGLSLGLSAVILGFWLGAVAGVGLILIGKIARKSRFVEKLLLNIGAKDLTMGSEIPFGPFLVAGLLLVYFLQIDVVGLGVLANM